MPELPLHQVTGEESHLPCRVDITDPDLVAFQVWGASTDTSTININIYSTGLKSIEPSPFDTNIVAITTKFQGDTLITAESVETSDFEVL